MPNFENDSELLVQAFELMREYRDAQSDVAGQAGPEDMGDINVDLILRRAQASAAICQFIDSYDEHHPSGTEQLRKADLRYALVCLDKSGYDVTGGSKAIKRLREFAEMPVRDSEHSD